MRFVNIEGELHSSSHIRKCKYEFLAKCKMNQFFIISTERAEKLQKREGESWMIPEAMLVDLHWTYGTMQLLFPNILIDLLRKLDVVVDLKSLKASCFPEGQQCARRHKCVCKQFPQDSPGFQINTFQIRGRFSFYLKQGSGEM